MPAPESKPTPVYDCIVIGAGPAGISTARTLSSLSPHTSVLVLEARGRVGGRTLTSTTLGVPVDLGASWIHHYSPTNPVVPLAKQAISAKLGLPKPPLEEEKAPGHAHRPGGGDWEDAGVPLHTTACYCGFVDAVDDDGKAMHVPSPFPGLGGGEGRFVLFDHDGARISKDVYTQAVAIYNRLIQDGDDVTVAMQLALPTAPYPRSAGPSPDLTPELEANYVHYAAATATVDRPILELIMPALDAELERQPEEQRAVLRRVVEFLLSGSEQFEGASMDGMSGMYWQAGSEGSGAVDCDMLVQRGYGDVIRSLADGLDIRMRHVVRRIDYSSSLVALDVEIEDEGEQVVGKLSLLARYVVVTVPLGVLKRPGAVTFMPALPAVKADAIERFGFGLMNKIVLQFDRAFWGEDVISIGYCSETRGLYRWILSLQPALQLSQATLDAHPGHAYEGSGSPAVLVCFSTADVGKEVEAKSDEQQKDEVMAILRACFTRPDINAATSTPPAATRLLPTADTVLGTDREMLYSGVLSDVGDVPEPTRFLVTRWWGDRFAGGSYSHYALGCNELTVEVLAASVGEGKVGFAGEHTCSSSMGCVDSAWETGIREGQRVASLLLLQQQRSTSA